MSEIRRTRNEQDNKEQAGDWKDWPTHMRDGSRRSVDTGAPIVRALLVSMVGCRIVDACPDYAGVSLTLDDGRRVVVQGHWTNTSEDAAGVSWEESR